MTRRGGLISRIDYGHNKKIMSMLSGSPVLLPILTPAAACGSAAFIRRLRISEPGAT